METEMNKKDRNNIETTNTIDRKTNKEEQKKLRRNIVAKWEIKKKKNKKTNTKTDLEGGEEELYLA